jgi:hypothetical protein
MLMAIRRDIANRWLYAFALSTMGLLCAGAGPARAEFHVVVSGPGTLTIEAHDAKVCEILEALSESRTIEFHSSDAMSRVVTGTYTGTLPRVLGRILDGYNHVIQATPSGVRIIVVGDAKSAGTPCASRQASP